jgi:hypothetical protein
MSIENTATKAACSMKVTSKTSMRFIAKPLAAGAMAAVLLLVACESAEVKQTTETPPTSLSSPTAPKPKPTVTPAPETPPSPPSGGNTGGS